MNQNDQEVGLVKDVKDFLIQIDGLPNIQINEIVENEAGVRGWVHSLLADSVEVLLLTEGRVVPQQIFKRTNQRLSVPVGTALLGRAINPLGATIDGKGPLDPKGLETTFELDRPAKGIESREFIKDQFVSGVTLVDTLIPLAKGQRELVVGDARSGKTSFLLDTIVNQASTDTICIYGVIGKPLPEVKNLLGLLESSHSFSHTIVVAATSNDLPPLIHLTPQTVLSIAEYFQRQGKDVLIILDDMGIHAKIYREIALLSNRSPGRESYPGDIFYQHSHLMERAGKFNQSAGGGSITALPVIEININDLTTFIPTNLMSMTDGHLLFRSSMYNQGQNPAVDVSLSVSRVGQQTQQKIQNLLSTHIKQVLALASQLETVSRFSFDLPASTQLILKQRELLQELFKQDPLSYAPREVQTILLSLPFTSFLQQDNLEFVKKNRARLVDVFKSDNLLASLAKSCFQLNSEEELFNQVGTFINYIQGVTNKSANPDGVPVPPPPPVKGVTQSKKEA